jgi:glycosyltransferase involved in cell wall biosynthesis
MTLRVLHVVPSLDPREGGVAEAVVQLVNHMRPHGCIGEVASLDGPDAAISERIQGTVHRLGPGRGQYGLSWNAVRWLRAHAGQYHAIIVHGIWQFHSLAARLGAGRARTPLFVFPHGMLDPWFERTYPLKHLKKRVYWTLAERWVFRRARAVLFTCRTELELARRPFLDRRMPLEVTGFGIAAPPDDATGGAAFLEAYPQLRGKRIVLFLSRVHEKKGCDLLIDAFAQAASRHPHLRLVMAGPGEAATIAALQRDIRARGIESQVVWTGMLSGALKWAALRAAEVFVLPSHQENFGIAVVEALASSTPVIITDRVNIWREIAAGGAGFVVPDTKEGVAEGVVRWCETMGEAELAAMRERALACYREEFRIEGAASKLVELIAAAAPATRRAPLVSSAGSTAA